MGRRLPTMLAAVFALAFPAAASTATIFGAAEDTPKFASDEGSAVFADMNDVGLRVGRVSVLWDPGDPFLIERRTGLDRMVAAAEKAGVQIVFGVYPRDPAQHPHEPGQPCGVRLLPAVACPGISAGGRVQAFRGGWFHSGDLAVWHPDGNVELCDRGKDIIISGGENISSIEVEQAIVAHPAVLECGVVAIPIHTGASGRRRS